MADEDRLLKARTQGSHASGLLHDEVLLGIFAELKRAYAEKLLNTAVDRPQDRETLYQAHRIIGEVERHLQLMADDGKLADHELNSLIKAQETKPRFGQ